jgi:hypothetical protein
VCGLLGSAPHFPVIWRSSTAGRRVVKPWEQDPPPGRRTEPEPLATDRSPSARQPGETLAAYKAFLGSLEHGSNRATARALGVSSQLLDRYSRRWRWPERKARLLASSARQWKTLTDYEEKRNLPAAADSDELARREMAAFDEKMPSLKKSEAQVQRLLDELDLS